MTKTCSVLQTFHLQQFHSEKKLNDKCLVLNFFFYTLTKPLATTSDLPPAVTTASISGHVSPSLLTTQSRPGHYSH